MTTKAQTLLPLPDPPEREPLDLLGVFVYGRGPAQFQMSMQDLLGVLPGALAEARAFCSPSGELRLGDWTFTG